MPAFHPRASRRSRGSPRPRSCRTRSCPRGSLLSSTPPPGPGLMLLLQPQRPPHRVPEGAAAGLLGHRIFDLAELFEQLALLDRELVGGPDVHAHVEVAVPGFAEARQPFVAQAIRHAGLRARLHPQLGLAVRRRHLHVGAERGLRERDAEVVDEIVAVALEPRVFLDVEHRDQVAGRTVARAENALAAQREVVVIGDAGGDVDLNRLLALYAPLAATALARIANDRALTAAGRTGRHGEELAEQGLRLVPQLAAAAARAALHGLRALFGAGAAAHGACLEALDPDRLRGTGRDFGERELQSDFDVVATAPLAALPATEQIVEPAERSAAAQAEVAHEHHERFGQIKVHGAEASRPALAAHARHAVAIIGGAFLRIAQHLVRLRDQLELLLGRLVAVVAVGMALHRQSAVGFLDIGFARVVLDAEDDVEVLLHAIRATPRPAATCD